jgi:hypothetical protein
MATDLKYPVGKFVRPTSVLTNLDREKMIDSIAAAPSALRTAVETLDDARLDTPYRPGGWTVRQVVHHLPDSHINAYCRFKLALTEDTPTIKPYDESRWAEMPDGRSGLVDESLQLLEALHARWVLLLRAMKPSDFERMLNHPEWDAPLTLDHMLALYSWHGRHHVAHITELAKREGWS